MKPLLISLAVAAVFAANSFAQTSWLDKPVDSNWNKANGIVPAAPKDAGPIDAMCKKEVRAALSLPEKALEKAGWHLYGPVQTYGNVMLLTAMAGADGMCRPNQYNAFVFVANRFVGTVSPVASEARSDGAISSVHLGDPTRIIAEFVRYEDSDALCCPSRRTYVAFTITTGSNPVVKFDDSWTEKICREGERSGMNVHGTN